MADGYAVPRRRFFERAFAFVHRLRYEAPALARSVPHQPVHPMVSPARDIATALACAAGITVLRYLFEVVLLKQWLLPRWARGGKLGEASSSSKASKIAENAFYALFYVLSFSAGALVYRGEPWSVHFFAPSCLDALWEIQPPAPPRFRLFYLFELGYYLSCLLFLVAHDTRRKDFTEYVVHHVSTVALIVFSYTFGWMRMGLVILLLHDCGDILLYSAKVIHYIGVHPWDMVVFGLFTATFYVSRLFLFPRIIVAVTVEPWILVTRESHSVDEWVAHWYFYISQLVVCALFLHVLLLLHCFWFTLIARMIKRELLEPGKQGDIRSDEESD